MDLRTALITGASSGIGDALARELAGRGVEVALCARRVGKLEELAADIRRKGGAARVYPMDVRDVSDTRETIARADDDMSGLDIVVANAGVGRQRWSGKLRWREDVEPTLAVNVHGAAATLTAVLDRMVERRRGYIVGISSLAQYRGVPSSATYSASKAFLSTFLEGLRIDLKSSGVGVTDVRPGFVRTEMTRGNKHRMPWLMEPEEAARVILRGIERREPVVQFPWQLATVARSAALLPPVIYDRAVARAKNA